MEHHSFNNRLSVYIALFIMVIGGGMFGAFAQDVSSQPIERSATIDSDQDGIPDSRDNCQQVVNPDQLDANESGIGDACETEWLEQIGETDETGAPMEATMTEEVSDTEMPIEENAAVSTDATTAPVDAEENGGPFQDIGQMMILIGGIFFVLILLVILWEHRDQIREMLPKKKEAEEVSVTSASAGVTLSATPSVEQVSGGLFTSDDSASAPSAAKEEPKKEEITTEVKTETPKQEEPKVEEKKEVSTELDMKEEPKKEETPSSTAATTPESSKPGAAANGGITLSGGADASTSDSSAGGLFVDE